jgi:hypothetical protein
MGNQKKIPSKKSWPHRAIQYGAKLEVSMKLKMTSTLRASRVWKYRTKSSCRKNRSCDKMNTRRVLRHQMNALVRAGQRLGDEALYDLIPSVGRRQTERDIV